MKPEELKKFKKAHNDKPLISAPTEFDTMAALYQSLEFVAKLSQEVPQVRGTCDKILNKSESVRQLLNYYLQRRHVFEVKPEHNSDGWIKDQHHKVHPLLISEYLYKDDSFFQVNNCNFIPY